MGLLKDLFIDFCLFSLVEGFIFCLFFEKIGGCKRFKWYEVFILSFGNCIISQIFPPLIYQIVMTIFMSEIIYFTKNKNQIKCFKIVILAMIFMLITEMTFAMFYEFIFKFELFFIKYYKLFLNMIILRIIQLFLIKILGGHRNESLVRTNQKII